MNLQKKMHFHVRGIGNKSTRDRTHIKLRKSSAIMASGFSTVLLSTDPDELCNRLKFLLQKKNKLETILI